MAKYRKKPELLVEAFCWSLGNEDQINDPPPSWFAEALAEPWGNAGSVRIKDGSCQVCTKEGVTTIATGDYVIKGVFGELTSCRPDIFEDTFEDISRI